MLYFRRITISREDENFFKVVVWLQVYSCNTPSVYWGSVMNVTALVGDLYAYLQQTIPRVL